jgi:ubiquitin carboxyl-terminal hydrolase 7
MCNVSEVDIAEHVAARLKKEAEEKDRKRVEKQEAHLFTYLKIATDQDFTDQIGKDRWFDLVDHEKVCT